MSNFFRIAGITGIALFLIFRLFFLFLDFLLLLDQNIRFVPDFLYQIIQEIFYRGYISAMLFDTAEIVLAGSIILIALSLPKEK